MEYYVFADQAGADTCIGAINGTDWFPITGNRNGVPDPTAQKTINWCTDAQEMVSGEYAVPKIPDARLDYVGVPMEEREAFLAVFGQDIRELTAEDFPPPPEEE